MLTVALWVLCRHHQLSIFIVGLDFGFRFMGFLYLDTYLDEPIFEPANLDSVFRTRLNTV